ncbi:MAG TPA: hypothetical protein VN130_11690 [Xanthobacteraceae bacterium]|nr:hypothetical protein [Xanthobacteraceae bacterium]
MQKELTRILDSRQRPVMVGVAALLETFYKPGLDAAHNARLQANRPILDGALIPSPGVRNENWDRST